MTAIENGVARIKLDRQTVHDQTLRDINQAREMIDLLMKANFIKEPDPAILQSALDKAVAAVRG